MFKKNKIKYSEEVQNILGKIPGWIIRWGITLILTIFSGIIIGCYFIKYPQVITAPITITTFNPPADLLARSTGRIDSIFVNDGDYVNKDDIICYLYNTASYVDVKSIYDSLKKNDYLVNEELVKQEWIDNEHKLGEIQDVYLEFQRTCLVYRHYLNTDNIRKKTGLIREQIVKNRQYHRKQLDQRGLFDADIALELKNLERDSILHRNKIISVSDYEQSIRALLQKQSSLKGFEASLAGTELSILQIEQQLIELAIQKDNERSEYNLRINNAKQQLLTQIEQWNYQYIIIAPIKGKITFIKYWSNNQTVQTGERIASIIPSDSMKIVGRMRVPMAGFGKVEKKQKVNIKLSGYPYMEYGMLKGVISNISEVPETEGYIVEVSIENNMVSTYHKKLNLIQGMDGVGEIITKDQRLIERFIQPIKALFDK